MCVRVSRCVHICMYIYIYMFLLVEWSELDGNQGWIQEFRKGRGGGGGGGL